MGAPNIKVKCSVENCKYNADHLCHAFGLEVGAMGDGHAETSDGTCCETFKSKYQ